MTGLAGGVLYVVATPIGNLGDMTIRAIDVLRTVPLIAAEDTRRTRILLDRHDIQTRMTSYHARSPVGRSTALLGHLRGGADLALVSDAGTPVVSDPGHELVSAWAAEGGRISPIPGASAVLAAVAATGLTGPRWAFEGFLPRRGRERRDRLTRIAEDDRATIVFEAPDRVAGTLRDLANACGPDRLVAVCRELTKVHESIIRGTLDAVLAASADGTIPARGEFVLVVAGRPPEPAAEGQAESAALTDARTEVERLVAAGVARGDAARRVAATTGLPRRRLYGLDRTPSEPSEPSA